jgi:hypothetical protein
MSPEVAGSFFNWHGVPDWHGIPPLRGVLLSFASPKESKQRKGDPGSAPLRGTLRYSSRRAACLNSPAAQTRQGDYPRPACVAQRLSRGPKGVSRSNAIRVTDFHGQPEKKPKIEIHPSPSLPRPRHTRDSASRRAKRESRHLLDSRLRGNDRTTASPRIVSPGPLRGAEQRRGWRIKGEDCLRAKPEFRSPRQLRVAQGTGNAGTDPGSPSSLATFFLAKQEESTPAPQARKTLFV